MKTLRHLVVGALVTLLVALAAAAPAQADTGPPLRVDGFDVEQVTQLSVGTALHFSLFGTPGASATLRIDGAERRLPLREDQAGVYEGTYVITANDRITTASRVTADLWLANQVTTAVLEEPLLLGASAVRLCDDCGVVEAVRAVEVSGQPGYVGAIAGGVIGAILGSHVGDWRRPHGRQHPRSRRRCPCRPRDREESRQAHPLRRRSAPAQRHFADTALRRSATVQSRRQGEAGRRRLATPYVRRTVLGRPLDQRFVHSSRHDNVTHSAQQPCPRRPSAATASRRFCHR